MKQTKRIFAVLLAVLMLCSAAPFAVQGASIVESGYCGDEGDGSNLIWTLDDEGTLIISGEGRMKDYIDSWREYRDSIKTVVIESGVTSIGGGAFENCTSLQSVTIHDGIASIGEGAFYGCSNLKSVTIPDSVTYIDQIAFAFCFNLNIEIGKGVEQIGASAFDCLKYISVDENNPNFSSENGVLFNKDKTTLITYPSFDQRTEYIIPDTVEVLEDWAFSNAIALKKIKFPKNLKKIGAACFCQVFLDEYVLPSSVEEIGEIAFSYTFIPFDFTIKSLNAELNAFSLGFSGDKLTGISTEEAREKFMIACLDHSLGEFMDQYTIEPDYDNGEDYFRIATIHCHAGSTAEAYAIENGMDYELTHFFEGDWTYDWDNLIRYRKCIHCDELETESLTSTEPGDENEPSKPNDTEKKRKSIFDYILFIIISAVEFIKSMVDLFR